MKKHYEKPLVAIEYYELTQTIASCNVNINLYGTSCVLTDPDSTNGMKDMAMKGYFISQGACTLVPEFGNTTSDGICYHTSINTAFTS